MKISPLAVPELDPDFISAALWNRAFQEKVRACGGAVEAALALLRPDDSRTVFNTRILPAGGGNDALNLRYLERVLKFLLWQRGGCRVLIAGADALATQLARIYSPQGARAFDHAFLGEKTYLQPFEIAACARDEIPEPNESALPLGRNLEGCRIGFDLGGSDRKCAAVIDGKVVFSEEVEWNPYFESDPSYHIEGVHDSLLRAAAHLPRVDAIGGSAAGVYVNNEARVASLFRGVSDADFETRVRRMFLELKTRWNNVPFEVVNDGDVTALAGAMSLDRGAVLGLAMGTSEAVGYVNPEGHITNMLNELAFAPVDYRADAPVDEWSGGVGCGAQYFSQQAVGRLAPAAGFEFPAETPLPERLVRVQQAMAAGDERARKIYSTIGTYLGHSLAHYADFYEIGTVLLLGRVMSGEGGDLIIEKAEEALAADHPNLRGTIQLSTPNEQDKRHGQAVAAASLPALGEAA